MLPDVGMGLPCRLAKPGSEISGIFMASEEEGCAVKLVSFSDFFYIEDNEPIHLILANAKSATILEHFKRTQGTASSTTARVTHSHHTGNVTVVGPDHWQAIDKVSSIYFSLLNIDSYLVSFERRYPAPETLKQELSKPIIKACIEECEIEAIWLPRMDQLSTDSNKVFFSISFKTPVPITQAHDYCTRVRTFFSACAGWPVHIFETHVRKADARGHAGELYQLYVGRRSIEPIQNLQYLAAPYNSLTPESTKKLEKGLEVWVSGYRKRLQTITLLMQAISYQTDFSEDRFMNACRWLDSIPEAAPAKCDAVDNRARSIKEAAIGLARFFQDKNFLNRVQGAVARLDLETHAQRFCRLVPIALQGCDFQINASKLEQDLVSAIRLRGKIAHGSHIMDEPENVLRLWTATTALEAFCYLMTITLLTPEPDKRSLLEHPFILPYAIPR